jgi:hypothetical protein
VNEFTKRQFVASGDALGGWPSDPEVPAFIVISLTMRGNRPSTFRT